MLIGQSCSANQAPRRVHQPSASLRRPHPPWLVEQQRRAPARLVASRGGASRRAGGTPRASAPARRRQDGEGIRPARSAPRPRGPPEAELQAERACTAGATFQRREARQNVRDLEQRARPAAHGPAGFSVTSRPSKWITRHQGRGARNLVDQRGLAGAVRADDGAVSPGGLRQARRSVTLSAPTTCRCLRRRTDRSSPASSARRLSDAPVRPELQGHSASRAPCSIAASGDGAPGPSSQRPPLSRGCWPSPRPHSCRRARVCSRGVRRGAPAGTLSSPAASARWRRQCRQAEQHQPRAAVPGSPSVLVRRVGRLQQRERARRSTRRACRCRPTAPS